MNASWILIAVIAAALSVFALYLIRKGKQHSEK